MRLILKFLIFSIFFLNFSQAAPIFTENIEDKLNVSDRNDKNDFSFTRYRLGTGDRIVIKIFKLDSFGGIVSVLPDGTINVPRIGEVSAKGKTIAELKETLIKKYKLILKDPIIYIDLAYTRPIRVMITGEVSRPGIYTLDTSENSRLSNVDGGEITSINSSGWPTVIEAIQKAGGVKTDSNIKEIQLRREDKTINVDLWSSLKYGELVNNPLLFDGDSIVVPIAKEISYDDSYKISSSSFSAANITVSVIGEVKNPGKVTLLANSPISQSIYLAGGHTVRANKSYADLIRLNKNGSITKTRHKKIFKNSNSNSNNVLLKDGDVVIIERSGISKTSDSLKNITQPFEPILNIRTIYRILND